MNHVWLVLLVNQL